MTLDLTKPLMNRLGWPVRLLATDIRNGFNSPSMAVALLHPMNIENLINWPLHGRVKEQKESPHDIINEIKETVTPDMVVNWKMFLIEHKTCQYIAKCFGNALIVDFPKPEERFYINGSKEELAEKCIRRVSVPWKGDSNYLEAPLWKIV